jgi:hypothetical protein
MEGKMGEVELERADLGSQSLLEGVEDDQGLQRFRVLRSESKADDGPGLRDLIRAASDAFWFG